MRRLNSLHEFINGRFRLALVEYFPTSSGPLKGNWRRIHADGASSTAEFARQTEANKLTNEFDLNLLKAATAMLWLWAGNHLM